MLRVRIELVRASDGHVREIGRMNIANTGSGRDAARGDYSVQVLRRGDAWPDEWEHDPLSYKVTRTGSVNNYPRLSYNVWRLVIRALLSAFPEERQKSSSGNVDKSQ